MIQFYLSDEAETAAFAAALALRARPGDVLALWGDLGAGKTVFARGFVRARCGSGEDVPSPTFTLVQLYPPAHGFQGTVFHFDLYRLRQPEDAVELDIEEAFADGISLIEWPDRLGHLLPDDRLDVFLADGAEPTSRLAELKPRGDWRDRLRGLGRD